MSTPPWWERFPGLLEAELAALDAAGIAYEIDDRARSDRDVIRILIRACVDGQAMDLIATYPDLYPFFRFEVQAPDVSLGRHQHPFGRTLCLIGRRTANWNIDDTLAAFLRDRLPLTLATARAPTSEAASESEEHQGEPFTDYYTYELYTAILVDSSWRLDVAGGKLTIGLTQSSPHPQLPRGAVTSVHDHDDREIAVSDQRLLALYDQTITGRWVRLPKPPPTDRPDAVLAEVVAVDPSLQHPAWQRPYGKKIDIIGCVFPEEVNWRTTDDAWIFVVRRVVPANEPPR